MDSKEEPNETVSKYSQQLAYLHISRMTNVKVSELIMSWNRIKLGIAHLHCGSPRNQLVPPFEPGTLSIILSLSHVSRLHSSIGLKV